jgi:glutamate-1-semialdehyde 2,1-aminomutase
MGLVPPKEGFLAELRELTRSVGALLICDEVINGFRFGLSTYSSLFANVEPDIVTLGKVIGGGLPLAAVGGKSIYMDRFAPEGPVYQAGTLAGNPLAVAAGLKTLEILERDNPYPGMAAKCGRIAHGVNAIAQDCGIPLRAAHFGGVFTLFCSTDPVNDLAGAMRCDTALYAKVFHGLYDRGIYVAPSQFECNFVSAAHSDADVDCFISVMDEIFRKECRNCV